jgi:segregation and condensation protein B
MTMALKYIVEALLFVTEEPLSIQQLKSILETEEAAAIQAALEDLAAEYDRRGGGFELRQVAGGYQLRTRAEYSEWVKKLLKPSPSRLSRAALETLAIIAYKQPIIRADVEHIRGVDCGGVLRMLLEKKLIRVMGRKDIPGRPMIYGTTRQFLEVFNLKDLRDLPSPKEIEALGAELDVEFPDAGDADGAARPAAESIPANAEGLDPQAQGPPDQSRTPDTDENETRTAPEADDDAPADASRESDRTAAPHPPAEDAAVPSAQQHRAAEAPASDEAESSSTGNSTPSALQADEDGKKS